MFAETGIRAADVKPGSDVARRVGLRLKSLRKARNVSLAQLSQMTGLSLGLLSGLERGANTPTLRSLTALAGAFGLPVGWFYDLEDGAQTGEVVLKRGRGRRFMWSEGVEKTLLNPDFGGGFELLLVTISPGDSSGPQSYSHGGEEGGYVLEGVLELWIDERRHLLESGDSFLFPSARAHRFSNPGNAPTKVVWVLTPALYQGRAPK